MLTQLCDGFGYVQCRARWRVGDELFGRGEVDARQRLILRAFDREADRLHTANGFIQAVFALRVKRTRSIALRQAYKPEPLFAHRAYECVWMVDYDRHFPLGVAGRNVCGQVFRKRDAGVTVFHQKAATAHFREVRLAFCTTTNSVTFHLLNIVHYIVM